ncbi:MAG: hypothetical protein LUE98_09280 [Tannerellaceae bacterium]|nr:hypothetical protein [Tannerellaceae bacterium]
MIITSNNTGKVSKNPAYNELGINNILFDMHSHPGQGATEGASWESELSPGKGRTGGDMTNIINLYNQNKAKGKGIPDHYLYHQESKVLYHYTPWKSDIYIRKIRNYNGLDFLIPKRK